ncbi:MAG: NAD-dependent succinate-semialdehyde dehydrogenase [Proteobacteria bacterium]|nr:NAD-dependent succinate-semialdehyde dehydrogenase [Pseudomonadota bacterium]MDA0927646.1 NAD-dependent succinate-semialdehyde dehydrogenase [Pseudomonadota bacterium]
MKMETINPATGEVVRSYDAMSAEQVADIIEKAAIANEAWQQTSFAERSALMLKAGEVLLSRKQELAALMCEEMGKNLAGGEAEIEKCASACEYYALNAEKFLQDEMVETSYSVSKVSYRPLGVVFAVMPWNFPYWQVFRFACPALMAGNGGILKHASNVCGSALAIEEIFLQAGFPENAFRTLLIGNEMVSDVIENPHIKAVTLTGSTGAGKAVGGKAGEMIKKSVLELGGSDPYVILADADIDKAVQVCVTSRLLNAGQSCIAAKRFIVDKSVIGEFTEKFVAAMKSKKMGDPTDRSNEIGPQARMDLRDELHKQVLQSVEKGANLLLGGEIPDMKGAYYPPTVLTNVKPGMPAYEEELFGPVAAIIEAEDEEDAIRIANDTEFGLGAGVFTEDLARGEEIATKRIKAGACFVNDFVKSDARLPFGGIGESGYGRELSHFGMHEFVNVKTVCVA